jgi:hypothetical protein
MPQILRSSFIANWWSWNFETLVEKREHSARSAIQLGSSKRLVGPAAPVAALSAARVPFSVLIQALPGAEGYYATLRHSAKSMKTDAESQMPPKDRHRSS